MRSRLPSLSLSLSLSLLIAAAAGGCAKQEQIAQCYPMTSWSAPVFRCASTAPAPPPAPEVVEKEPEPAAPEPEPPPPPKVEVKADRVELNEKVNFETGKATLLEPSKTLLDEVAQVLNDHPELQKIRIEGHTDGQSSAKFNMNLSNRRAKTVRDYLVKKGVSGKRLVAKGFGETKPLADNKTPEGREQNRRVELHIVKRAD